MAPRRKTDEGMGVPMSDVQDLAEQMRDAGPETTRQAAAAAGITLPVPGGIPDKAWDKMLHWQVFTLLLVMFLAIVAVFVALLVVGIDLARDNTASEASKTLGSTLVGAALGMIGASAAGAGTAIAKK